jgi:hypothetical protein
LITRRGAGVALTSPSGKPLAGLGADDEGSGLALHDAEGHERVSLAASADGRHASGTITYPQGKPCAALSAEAPHSGLRLMDRVGKERVSFTVAPGGAPALVAKDSEGLEEWRAP